MIKTCLHDECYSDSEDESNVRQGQKRPRNCQKGHGLIKGVSELSLDEKNDVENPAIARSKLYRSCDRGSLGNDDSPCNSDSMESFDTYLWEIYNTSDRVTKPSKQKGSGRRGHYASPIKQKARYRSKSLTPDSGTESASENPMPIPTRTITSIKSKSSKATNSIPVASTTSTKSNKRSSRPITSFFKPKAKSPARIKKSNKLDKENISPHRSGRASTRKRKPCKPTKSVCPKDSFFKGISFHMKPVAKKDKIKEIATSDLVIDSKLSGKKLTRHKSMTLPITSTPTSNAEKTKHLSFTEPRGKRKSTLTKMLFDPEINIKPNKIARGETDNTTNNYESTTTASTLVRGTSFFRTPLQDISNFDTSFGVLPISEDKQCTSCNTYETTMWREAEDGTQLCNACGIRWKKHHIKCSRCWFIPMRSEEKNSFCPNCKNDTMKRCNKFRRFSSSIY